MAIPTTSQLETLLEITNPKLAGYTPAQRALVLFLCMEAYTEVLDPWKLLALRKVLTTQEHVEQFRNLLENYASDLGLSAMSAEQLSNQMNTTFVSSPNAADWLVIQQELLPIKHLGRTVLVGRDYLEKAYQEWHNDLPKYQSPSYMLLYPKLWRESEGPGLVKQLGMDVLHDDLPHKLGGITRLYYAMTSSDNYTGGYTALAQFTAKVEEATVGVQVQPTPTPATAPAPSAATPANVAILKEAILQMIKQEVNTLLSAEMLTKLVAKQVEGNPSLLQNALGKVFNVSANAATAQVMTTIATEQVKTYLTSQGPTFLAQLVAKHLSQSLNISKIEQEAIKGLSGNLEGYFAAIFSRIEVQSADGLPIGKLGFKDKTALKAPMPGKPLTKGGGSADDIPF